MRFIQHLTQGCVICLIGLCVACIFFAAGCGSSKTSSPPVGAAGHLPPSAQTPTPQTPRAPQAPLKEQSGWVETVFLSTTTYDPGSSTIKSSTPFESHHVLVAEGGARYLLQFSENTDVSALPSEDRSDSGFTIHTGDEFGYIVRGYAHPTTEELRDNPLLRAPDAIEVISIRRIK